VDIMGPRAAPFTWYAALLAVSMCSGRAASPPDDDDGGKREVNKSGENTMFEEESIRNFFLLCFQHDFLSQSITTGNFAPAGHVYLYSAQASSVRALIE
jgi:hypothetical protein